MHSHEPRCGQQRVCITGCHFRTLGRHCKSKTQHPYSLSNRGAGALCPQHHFSFVRSASSSRCGITAHACGAPTQQPLLCWSNSCPVLPDRDDATRASGAQMHQGHRCKGFVVKHMCVAAWHPADLTVAVLLQRHQGRYILSSCFHVH